jgi:hypothetical protein
MPYVASADLALGMTRSGDLRVGSTTNYSITVTNNGPMPSPARSPWSTPCHPA